MFGCKFFSSYFYHADYWEAGGGILPGGEWVKERWGIKVGISIGF
jgi:hypothetical protein